VYNQWQPNIPYPNQWQPIQPYNLIPNPIIHSPWPVDPEEMRKFLEAFHAMVEAAKVFDELTGQPDCEDPEKAALEERVAELERKLERWENEGGRA
jgi:hypothetical protein